MIKHKKIGPLEHATVNIFYVSYKLEILHGSFTRVGTSQFVFPLKEHQGFRGFDRENSLCAKSHHL